jgi:arylformamidase
MSDGGYLGFDQATLDREYSPSSLVSSLQFYLDDYAARSAAARTACSVRTDLRYGGRPEERLDLFPAAAHQAPLQVFVHGGNWQELGKSESEFAAADFVAAGAAFAALDYGLAPGYRLDEIVDMVHDAVCWLHANAASLGVDPARIHLSGSSAGAHLVAMTLARDDAGRVAGAALLSGLYELEALRHSYVNDALGLDLAAAVRNSPVYRLPSRLPPVVVARGGLETGEFVRQHELMTALLQERAAVTEVIRLDRNHFDLPYDLGDAGTELGRAVLTQMRLPLAGRVRR